MLPHYKAVWPGHLKRNCVRAPKPRLVDSKTERPDETFRAVLGKPSPCPWSSFFSPKISLISVDSILMVKWWILDDVASHKWTLTHSELNGSSCFAYGNFLLPCSILLGNKCHVWALLLLRYLLESFYEEEYLLFDIGNQIILYFFLFPGAATARGSTQPGRTWPSSTRSPRATRRSSSPRSTAPSRPPSAPVSHLFTRGQSIIIYKGVKCWSDGRKNRGTISLVSWVIGGILSQN